MAAHPEHNPSVLSTLQSEVSSEASPMLQFLVRHARSIVFGILLFIVAIVGYWVYSWQAGKQHTANTRDLGVILIISDAEQRLSKLEAYIPSAPESLKGAAWFAVLESARQLKNYPKIQAAWQAIGELDPSLKVTASVGKASALAAQNKYKEALDALSGLSNLSQPDSFIVNPRIIAYAEVAGDYDRAIAACDAQLKLADSTLDPNVWLQKKAELEKKKAAAAKP